MEKSFIVFTFVSFTKTGMNKNWVNKHKCMGILMGEPAGLHYVIDLHFTFENLILI